MTDRDEHNPSCVVVIVIVAAGLAIWIWRISEWSRGNFWTW